MRNSERSTGRKVQDSYASWTIQWRLTDFAVRNRDGKILACFNFHTVVMPVEITISDKTKGIGYAVVKTDTGTRVRVLFGVPRAELERFKKRVSSQVLAAVRTSPYGCSDCARDAHMSAFMWSYEACPGCREFYCRDPKCLRRLTGAFRFGGSETCRHCGAENLASRRMDVLHLRD